LRHNDIKGWTSANVIYDPAPDAVVLKDEQGLSPCPRRRAGLSVAKGKRKK